MKHIIEMTPEEIAQLISIQSPKGVTIYYSLVSSVNTTDNSMVYNGKVSAGLTTIFIQEVTTGKANYEAYKLSAMKSDAELVIQERIDDTVKAYFQKDMQAITDFFNESYSSLTDKLNSLYRDADSSVRALSDIRSDLESADLPSLTSKANAISSSLETARNEFVLVTSKLKELFK